MDTTDQVLCLLIICWYLKRRSSQRIPMIRDHNSALTGYAYTLELLNGNDTQCKDLMHLSHNAYVQICNYFKEKNYARDGRYITVEEKMAIFLTMIAHNERFRMVKKRFQHSTQTIHHCFHEVLNGMMEFAKEIIVPTHDLTSSHFSERHKALRRIFSGAIGALDGTLIDAVVPNNQQTRFRGRGGGRCYQNVLAICDFNMMFTFVWAGWEGTTHDSRVLREVAFDPTTRFPFPPPNKYYLCDAAYTNTRGFLAPYRGRPYWLNDFRRRSARNKEERFNHAHAQLRNVIECAYGVLKARFPILQQMAPYTFHIQRDIVIACFAIHNFIRKYTLGDDLFDQFDQDNIFDGEIQQDEEYEEEQDEEMWGAGSIQYMANKREQIANQL